jgi:uncharacterized protein (TIGR00661 family)
LKNKQQKILVAPLNWGIGHATRCIPIINALIKQNFIPVIASDGDALLLLQKEFPKLKSYQLPSYNIKYTKHAVLLKTSLFFQSLSLYKTIKKEKKIVAEIIKKEFITGLISDNRFGVFSCDVPSVYITHQIKVLSGFTTWLTSKLHQKIINKFDECWVPDVEKTPNLSGKLSHETKLKIPIKYIGVLSRFKYYEPKNNDKKYNILILLSGLEPQRTQLEVKLINEFKNSPKKILFVRGVLSEKKQLKNTKHITFKNYLLQNDLQNAITQSHLIIARSGYSTIMDLAVLQKTTFFIPTPSQNEQVYLAKHLKRLKIAPFSTQNNFKLLDIIAIDNYNVFKELNNFNDDSLLNLFDCFCMS